MKTSIGTFENIVFWELSPLLQGHFNSLLENNKFGIISCSPFCSPKESSPQTVGVEGGGGGVSWKLYKFWSSSHLFLHSWTMQHYRKRPRNYGLIMVSIMSAWSVFDLFWFKLVECEGEKTVQLLSIYRLKVHVLVLKSSWIFSNYLTQCSLVICWSRSLFFCLLHLVSKFESVMSLC